MLFVVFASGLVEKHIPISFNAKEMVLFYTGWQNAHHYDWQMSVERGPVYCSTPGIGGVGNEFLCVVLCIMFCIKPNLKEIGRHFFGGGDIRMPHSISARSRAVASDTLGCSKWVQSSCPSHKNVPSSVQTLRSSLLHYLGISCSSLLLSHTVSQHMVRETLVLQYWWSDMCWSWAALRQRQGAWAGCMLFLLVPRKWSTSVFDVRLCPVLFWSVEIPSVLDKFNIASSCCFPGSSVLSLKPNICFSLALFTMDSYCTEVIKD